MVNARFFLDHKEVIGLWAIFVIVTWLGICIIDSIFESRKAKKVVIKRKSRYNKEAHEKWKDNFHRSFIENIVKF